ncbi:hypothetical protein lerEdw1_006175 [Lerista edwardsae]|nr:hypothetical protein lerEdw1_006175 [Lerista edwardsae]
MLSWLLPPMALHTHRGGLCRGEREAGLRGGGGGGGGESAGSGGGGGGRASPACLPHSVTEPLLLLGCCLRPEDPAERGLLLTPAGAMMAEGGGGQRQKALSLLEAARCRYESLQISDDVFGESGQDSSGNPFYSTSADSRSASEEDEDERDAPEGGRSHRSRTGGRRGVRAASEQQQVQGGSEATCPGPREQQPQPQDCGEEEPEDEEDQRGWSPSLRNTPTPSFKDSSGKVAGCGRPRGSGGASVSACGNLLFLSTVFPGVGVGRLRGGGQGPFARPRALNEDFRAELLLGKSRQVREEEEDILSGSWSRCAPPLWGHASLWLRVVRPPPESLEPFQTGRRGSRRVVAG